MAALTGDVNAVKKLIVAGASANARIDGDSVLGATVARRDFELARWLIARGAEIDSAMIALSDRNNHLASFTPVDQSFVAYLVYTQLSRKGLALPQQGGAGHVAFVRRTKEAIIENLKAIGPWPKDVVGWVVRIVHVNYTKGAPGTFVVRADIAAWTEGAMFELASSTGELFALPPSLVALGVASHAWVERPSVGVTLLALGFDADKVLSGDFRVTRKSPDTLIAEHFTPAR